MRERRSLRDVVTEAVAGGAFPSAVWRVFQGQQVLEEGAVGAPDVAQPDQPATTDLEYDLASLTKPLVTAPATLQALAEAGGTPGDPCADHGIGSLPLRERTVGDVLAHRAGLPAWLPLYALDPEPARALAVLADWPVGPAGVTVYGCPGYLLLGNWLDARGRLNGPRGLAFHGTGGVADGSRFAPTEIGRVHERQLASDSGFSDALPPAATGAGIVHDGNACFLGGRAGNAGLFGNAAAIHRRLLDLDDPVHAPMWVPWSGGHRSLAAVSAGDPQSHAHGVLTPGWFGHTGFTGTSFWFEPESQSGIIFLTNRVHPAVARGIDAERRAVLLAARPLWGAA